MCTRAGKGTSVPIRWNAERRGKGAFPLPPRSQSTDFRIAHPILRNLGFNHGSACPFPAEKCPSLPYKETRPILSLHNTHLLRQPLTGKALSGNHSDLDPFPSQARTITPRPQFVRSNFTKISRKKKSYSRAATSSYDYGTQPVYRCAFRRWFGFATNRTIKFCTLFVTNFFLDFAF